MASEQALPSPERGRTVRPRRCPRRARGASPPPPLPPPLLPRCEPAGSCVRLTGDELAPANMLSLKHGHCTRTWRPRAGRRWQTGPGRAGAAPRAAWGRTRRGGWTSGCKHGQQRGRAGPLLPGGGSAGAGRPVSHHARCSPPHASPLPYALPALQRRALTRRLLPAPQPKFKRSKISRPQLLVLTQHFGPRRPRSPRDNARRPPPCSMEANQHNGPTNSDAAPSSSTEFRH